MKFSINNGVVRYDGRLIRMQINDPWAADDPFVKDRPDLFADQPTFLHRSATPGPLPDPPVERATARPGEKRATSRKS